jgi:hypothetical protein
MRQTIVYEKFLVDDTVYAFEVVQEGLPYVMFYVVGGKHYVEDDFGDVIEDPARLLGNTNAFKTLRVVKALLTKYIFSHRPYGFRIEAKDSEKRFRVYKKMAKRYLCKIPYTMQIINNSMYFYKIQPEK